MTCKDKYSKDYKSYSNIFYWIILLITIETLDIICTFNILTKDLRKELLYNIADITYNFILGQVIL